MLTTSLNQPDISFNEFIRQEKITAIHATPAFFDGILAAATSADLETVQDIILAGDVFSLSLRDKIMQKTDKGFTRLWNLYGPTEGTIISTWYQLDGQEQQNIPVGKPVTNTRCFVLDEEKKPVPQGVNGQLYIGGNGVGAGYLNQAEVTAEKFIPDPWHPGATLYASGDIVRRNADGNLEYSGRIDRQVKVRGHRIELSAIETTILKFPDVEQTVVMVREDNPGQKEIVAYLKTKFPDIHGIKSWLSALLPEYAMPGYIICVPDIPLTTNGKTDLERLPKPEYTFRKENFEAPDSLVEKQLAQIWSDLLDLDINDISVNESFFDMGGDSILSIVCIAQCKEKGLSIKPEQLFKLKTIKKLAETIG